MPVIHPTVAHALLAATAVPGLEICKPPPPIPRKPDGTIDTKAFLNQPAPAFHPLTGALPPELAGHGFIRATDCRATRGTKYDNITEAQACGLTVFKDNPWCDCAKGGILLTDDKGDYYLREDPCLLGFGRSELKVYDLEGNVICTIFVATPDLPNPQLPPAQPGQDPGAGLPFGHPNVRSPGGGGGRPPISVGGLNVGDIGTLLSAFGAGADVSGIVRVIAGLVLAAGGINSTLGDLAPGLTAGLAPGFQGLSSALDDLSPGLGGRLASALDDHATRGQTATERANAFLLGAAPGAVNPIFQALVDSAGNTLHRLGDAYKGALDTLIGRMLDLFRDEIEAHAPVHPGNVDKVAAGALRAALTAGSAAQLAGMALELLHPIKSMGVQQAIGVLASFAGFDEIIKPFFGATLRYGMGLPAEHRAAAHFRSVLPPPEVARELAAIGLLDPNKYIERLELAGYPEPYPGLLNDIRFTPPNARFLAQLLDGSETDKGWLARQFRRLGFSPENIERGVVAAELKTTAPGRGRLVSVVLDAYKKGRFTDAELDAGLEGAGLSAVHRGYYRRVAELERRGDRMELIATEVVTQYRNDVVGEAALKQQLTALGFTEDEITIRVTAADLTKGAKQVQDEVKATEAEIRALKSKGLTLASRQLRAGFLDRATFVRVAGGMGYTRQFAETAADAALLQGKIKTKAGEPAIGTGALEETTAKIAELIAAEVAAKRMGRLAAVVSLRSVGLPHDLASTLIDVAEALAGPDHRAGDYGLPAGGAGGGAFGLIAQAVAGGLGGVKSVSDLVGTILASLGLPGRDRAALSRLIRDLQDLFGR